MNKRKLLFSLNKKDFKVETFRAGGKGGQHQNKTNTGVRIKHPASGAVAECRETRSQSVNKKRALHRLVETPKFKVWHNRMCHQHMTGKTLDEIVDELMSPQYVKVEKKGEKDRWERI